MKKKMTDLHYLGKGKETRLIIRVRCIQMDKNTCSHFQIQPYILYKSISLSRSIMSNSLKPHVSSVHGIL